MTLEQKRNIAITIRLSEAEADLLQEIAQRQHQTKTAVIVTAIQLYAQHLQQKSRRAGEDAPEEITPTPTTGAGEDQPHTTGEPTTPTTTTSPAGATETPTEGRQDSQPDYIRQDENAPQRAAENVRELTHSPTGKYYPAGRDTAENGSENENENTPGQVRVYTEAELKQAIQEAAQQAAQKAARQARQEIKREMKAQAIQATGCTIEAARRAKAATVSTVNGLKPLRIRRGKK